MGISIGVTRLLGLLFGADALSVSRAVPTCVLVAVTAEEDRAGQRPGRRRRCAGAGIPTEVSPSAAKFGKQIRYAERRGIPYVWFPGADGPTRSRTSAPASRSPPAAGEWTPPAGGPEATGRLSVRTGAYGVRTYGSVSYATVGRLA